MSQIAHCIAAAVQMVASSDFKGAGWWRLVSEEPGEPGDDESAWPPRPGHDDRVVEAARLG